jgi:hypothetical protein
MPATTPFALSEGLSFSKGFDKLSPNGVLTTTPFALSKGLSLSKARVEGLVACAQGFDKLSPNGIFSRPVLRYLRTNGFGIKCQ